MADETTALNPRDRFPAAISQLERARSFIQSPPEELDVFEAELSSLHSAIRRSAFRSTPNITTEVINAMHDSGEVESMPNSEELIELMRSVRVTGSDIQLLDGTGVIFAFERSTGKMYALTAHGHILDKTGMVDGERVLDFPGGLYDYAINKALTVASLEKLGSNTGLKSSEDASYIKDTTGVGAVHMGGNSYKTSDGREFFTGVSGAEMTRGAIEKINSVLPEQSQAGDYTIAGAVDEVVANWASRFVAGEEVSISQAQEDVDNLLNPLHVGAKLGETIPDQYH